MNKNEENKNYPYFTEEESKRIQSISTKEDYDAVKKEIWTKDRVKDLSAAATQELYKSLAKSISIEYEKLEGIFSQIITEDISINEKGYLQKVANSFIRMINVYEEIYPYVECVLNNDTYKGCGITIDDFYGETAGKEYTAEENDLMAEIWLAAKEIYDNTPVGFDIGIESANGIIANKKEAEILTPNNVKKVEFMVDKVNSNMWKLLENDTGSQITFNMRPNKHKKDEIMPVYYSIDFEEIEGIKITKKLTQYDKRVYIAAGAIWNAGNKVTSLTQLHYAMGNTSRPKEAQLKKINDSITKMANANIYIDNSEEAATLNYPAFKYDAKLLPIERLTKVIKGKETEAAIHLFREPPMLTFAKDRKQFTTLNIKLLQTPINQNETNLAIEHYLFERIGREKNQKKKSKQAVIKYETLFEECNISTSKAKTRKKADIKKLLDYYVECGYIKRHKERIDEKGRADAITVYF